MSSKDKMSRTIVPVPLGDIEISKGNVRLSDAMKDIAELADSIKRNGLLQPVVLMGKFGKPPYELISGQRRFLAHQRLKWPTIQAIFVDNLSKTDAIVRSLVENLQRLDLEFEDTARAVTYLYEKFGNDEYRVQKETGLSIRKIRDFILIEARATPKMKVLLREKKISPIDLKRAIRAAQDNLKKAEELVELIVRLKPTTHQKRRIVAYGERDKGASAQHILKEAMKPHVEQNMIINLPDDLRDGLAKATDALSMEPEELAVKVLADWLRAQGFVA